MIRIFRVSIAFLSLLIILCVSGSLVDESLAWNKEQRQGQRDRVELPATLGLDQGLIEFDTPDFNLKLMRLSQPSAVH